MADFIDPKDTHLPLTYYAEYLNRYGRFANENLDQNEAENLYRNLLSEKCYNYKKPENYEKIIFVHLPKCAGTFLRYFFIYNKIPVEVIQHGKESEVKEKIKNDRDFFLLS